MRKLTTTMKALMLVAAFFWFATGAMAQIVISQYIETNSGTAPKGIELWNTSGSTIDFSVTNLDIEKGGNGGTPTSDILITTGTLADGEVIVVGTSDLSPDYEYTFTFNGDDALVVKLDGVIVDVLGTPGSDPGSSWSGNGVSTANQNIQLKSGITTGDTDGWTDPSERFELVSADPVNDITGFGVAPEAATVDPEPTNHVTAFAATYSAVSMAAEVAWTDNDGAQPADGFLLKASTGAITPPVDFTEEADDTDLSDGDAVVNVAPGTEEYSFGNLQPGTTYNFEIYPYTNSGADIDYKTDAPVPTAQATTMAGLTWYNLQWPGSGTITIGDTYNVYAQAYEDGVTNADGSNPGVGIDAWIGYSTENTDPSTWTNWVVASYNGDSGSNDEFVADLGAEITSPGVYYYASRFQYNSGVYMYGGFVQNAGGPWDGTTNVSGVLTAKREAITAGFSETFDADLGNMLTYSVSGATKEWGYDGGEQAASMNGYNSGDVEEDWMILPSIDLSAKANEELTFDTWYKYGSDDADNYLKLMYSEDYDGVGDPSSATWTELPYTAPVSAESWETSGAVDIAAINGTEVYFAFKYRYESGSYRTWKIDNISLDEAAVGEVPAIANVVTTPMYPTSSDAINVSADVTDADGTIATVTLNWGTTSGSLGTAINMTVGTGDNYVVDTDIPAQADGTVIYYEIVAEDNDGNLTNTSEMMIEVIDPATATLPYTNDFATDLGDMYLFDAEGAQGWYQDEYGGSTYAKISGYSGTQLANVDYMITPAIDFSGVTAIQMSFDEIINFAGTIDDQQEVLVSTDYAGTGDPATATWTELTITNRPPGNNWDWVSVDVVDLSMYAGEASVHIAFKYTSTDSEAATWEVDNLVIEETPVVPVIENIVMTPDMVSPSDAVSISADVTDANGTISSVTLNWGTATGTLGNAINMTVSTGDTYVTDTDIPAQVDGTTVYYEIVAEDDEANVTTTDEMSYDVAAATQVADIATLRAGATDGTVYELTGEAVITYQRASRNQKYIQDATAGILIDDNSATITTVYNQYDGITGVTGTLSEYNGVLQFIPTADPGAATSTGNTVTPQTVLVTDITGDVDAYESELITFEGMTFADAGGTFASNQNYDISDGTNTITFRTGFSESDILGTTIPSGPQNITALVAEYNGTAQVYARDLADLVSLNPVIANIAISPVEPSSSDVVTVSADVTNDVGALTSVELNWGTATGTLTNTVVMTAVDDTYSGDIPAQADGTTVYYEIVATNDNANVTTSDEMSYDVIDYLVATQLSITNVTPVSPYITQMFNVEVTSLDVNGDVGLVSEDTEVQINLSTGTGSLAGTVTGTILNGTSSIVVSGLTYDVAETINLNASTVSGMTLTTSADFEVVVADLPSTPLVFISEYIEGSSNNKAIEIYNGTGAELDLTGFSVQKSSNGDGAWGSEEVLSGTLAAGDVFVIANASADAAILDVADVTSTVTYFNGNDAVGLFYNGTLIDVIGVPSEDVIWDVAGVTEAAANHTLVRRYPEVIIGNTDWVASAGTNADDSEWIVNDQDDFTGIGWHGTAPTEPAISNVAINPMSVTSTDAVSVSATVVDPNGTIASVTLNWGTVSGTLDNAINMSVSVDDTYVTDTDIPAQADGTTVYYEIVAVDNDAETTTTPEMMYEVSDPSVVTLPYVNGFDDDNLGDMYSYSVVGDQVWGTTSFGNPAPSAIVTGYDGGSRYDNEDWLITPGLDFSAVTNAYFTIDEAINYAGVVADENKIFVSTDYTGSGDPSAATWTELTVAGRSTGDNWDFVTTTAYDLSAYAGEATVYLAFTYYSTTTVAGTWELDNVNVQEGTAVLFPEISDIALTPAQPTSADAVTISATITDGDGTVETAVLHWGDTFLYGNEITMTKGTDDTWTADSEIPAQEVNTEVFYKIVATDNDSNETESDPATYSVYEPFAGVFPFYEPFYYDLGVMTTQSVAGTNEWYWDDYGYAKVSGYNNGPNEDWLVTPMLDLSGNYQTVTLMFEEAINYAGTIDEQQEVYISTDYVDDATTATWTKLTVTNRPVGDSWTFVDVDPISLNDYIGESSVYIGFKYTSTDTEAATWEVDNVTVEVTEVGINGANASNLTIYPNPAQNEVFVTGVKNITNVQILSLDGKVVMSEQTNNNRIDVSSVNDGMYILRVISGNEVYTTRFVKE
jgi:hypothetical protein